MKQLVLILMMMSCMSQAASTACAADYTLGIFGNANMDDTIDEKDVSYIEGVIKGTNTATNLSDANHDGEIDAKDIDQIEKIIRREETNLIIVDGNGEAVTIPMPLERIIVEFGDSAEMLRALNATNKIVGVTNYITENKNQFPELSKLPFVGNVYPGEPDYEAILSLTPDIYLLFASSKTYSSSGLLSDKGKNLPGLAVVYLGLYYADLTDTSKSKYINAVRTLGYIINRKDEAEEYVRWYLGWMNKIKSRTEGLSDAEKPRVFMTSTIKPQSTEFRTYPSIDTLSQMCAIAGGKNIAESIPEFTNPASFYINPDAEWVIEQDPAFIFVCDSGKPYGYDLSDPTRMKEISDTFMNHSALANVTAVMDGNVYVINAIFRNGGSGGIIGAAYLAKLLHPDLFEDLDPQAIHQEYLTRFQHLDYDLDKQGEFVYPPLEES